MVWINHREGKMFLEKWVVAGKSGNTIQVGSAVVQRISTNSMVSMDSSKSEFTL